MKPQIQKFVKQNRWVVIGVAGAVLAFVGGAGLHATAIPWLGSADAPYHLDYAWKVYNGTLPQFSDGLSMPGLSNDHWHLATQHPPLYYTLLAPLVGPFLANGSLGIATGIARMYAIGIGVLSLLALAWTGWIVGGRHRRILAVAAPAVGGTVAQFIGVNSAVYSDALMILFVTVAVALSVLLVRNGPRRGYIIALALVLLLGMASRVAFLGMLGLAVLTLVASFIVHGKARFSANTLKGIRYGVLVSVFVTLGIGWFYYFHNFEASGSFISARPETSPPDRPYTSFSRVIISEDLWELTPFRLFGNSFRQLGERALNNWLSLFVVGAGVAGTIAWFFKQKAWKFINALHSKTIIIIGMLVALFGITFAQQVVYATGYGGYHPRYLLPAWAAIALMIAFGVSVWRQLRGLGVVVVVSIGWLAMLNWTIYALTNKTNSSAGDGWVNLLQIGVENNGFPAFIAPLLLGVMVAGVVLVGISSWRLTGGKNEGKMQREYVAWCVCYN